MPQAIPKGPTREGVLRVLADRDAGVKHPFGPATGYELAHDGRRYPPKAVVGLASRSLLGRVLRPEKFSGGEAPGQANFVLRGPCFTVERKTSELSAEDPGASAGRAGDWTRREVDLVVADYFAMLRAELAGAEYGKADHNRDLRPRLGGRSKGSVEYKHQNISAVLAQMGLPYIEGYKPAQNFQKALLPRAIEDHLAGRPDLLDALAGGPILDPAAGPEVADGPVEALFEAPPERVVVPAGEEKPWLSFDEADGAEQLIEVKTTGLVKHFPFCVTATEVRCSEDCPDKFRLDRVFDFARVYVMSGSLSRECRLDPVAFRASI